MNDSSVKYHQLRYPWGSSWAGMMLFCGQKNILIDTAVPEAENFLKDELSKYALTVADIDIVINTHMHSDHCGLNAFLESAGAEIRKVNPGEIIDGENYMLSVIAAPGHSEDSVCFLEPDSGILFAGDALEGRGTCYAGVALYQNPTALLETISNMKKLAEYGAIKKIFLGHSYDQTGGIVLQKDILSFLNLCTQTILNYDSFLKSLPADLSINEVITLLLKKYGITENPINRACTAITVNAHRKFSDNIVFAKDKI